MDNGHCWLIENYLDKVIYSVDVQVYAYNNNCFVLIFAFVFVVTIVYGN